MHYVKDLQVETEVLPLFNYTHNAYAEAVLLKLLTNVPATLEMVRERQDITKGFLENWRTLAGFSYQKLQFQEVHSFLAEVSSGRLTLETNYLKASLKLWLSEEERYTTRARYVQMVQFLHRQQHYLACLAPSALPAAFRARLIILSQFMERLSVSAYAAAIQEGTFSAVRVARFAQALSRISADEVDAFWNAFYQFEAYWSIANGMVRHAFTFPVFGEEAFRLRDFYHPLLKNPVKNSLALRAGENVVLLTGPNMSGKSTLLKAVGLCVYLAHVGVGVPAAECRLPFFRTIAVAINLNDSLRDGYSHFMAEIQNLKAVLRATHEHGRTFAIFDELFRGTNVDDALDITRATVNGLASFAESYFLISTHLLQLENHRQLHDNVQRYYIDCTLTTGVPTFSYQLKPGWSTLKIGRLLFDQEGLDELLSSET